MSSQGTAAAKETSSQIENTIQSMIVQIGDQKINCLQLLFKELQGMPPSVHRARFRANHSDLMKDLDELEHPHLLLTTDRRQEAYILSPFALPLLKLRESEKLISVQCEVYLILQAHYKERLDERITAEEICSRLKTSQNIVLDALYYLHETHTIFSGWSNGFPYEKESSVGVREDILKRRDYNDVLMERYVHMARKAEVGASFPQGSATDTDCADVVYPLPQPPPWLDKLPAPEKALLLEIDKAVLGGMAALPVMGMRALIENAMVSRVGDNNSFASNLKEFVDKGYITEKQRELLHGVIETGSAVMHRAHFPSVEHVTTCMEVVKHLLQMLYDLNPRVDEMRQNTPARRK